MTPEPDLTALALALASAKKPCPCIGNPPCAGCLTEPVGHQAAYNGPNMDVLLYACGPCGGTGEVYVLGSEVRVECVGGPFFRVTVITAELIERHKRRGKDCSRCQGRGWTPLDPKLLGDWMVALAKVMKDGIVLEEKEKGEWWCIWDDDDSLFDTPGEAFFDAALVILSLPKVTEPNP